MFQEFPKALYFGGRCTPEDLDEEGVFTNEVTVQDAQEEAARNAEGYYMLGQAPEGAPTEPPKRRGQPRKVQD